MNNDILIQQFGYSEMYEWVNTPNNTLGLFVQFSKNYPEKIVPYFEEGSKVLGISTINSCVDSDDPEYWHLTYVTNNVGDLYLKKNSLAVGVKSYDQDLEISYIHTMPFENLIRIESDFYKKDIQYIKRTKRREWVRVNLIGKAIVIDNGECEPGKYCMPYVGREVDKMGTAIPYVNNLNSVIKETPGFYILERVSENSILIVNSPNTNI